MNLKTNIYFLSFIFLFTSLCSAEQLTELKIDASSGNMEPSIEEIRNSLSEEKREQFTKALTYLKNAIWGKRSVKKQFSASVFRGEAGEFLFSVYKKAFHGKTAGEIISLANKIRKSEIEYLEDRLKTLGDYEQELTKINIITSSIQSINTTYKGDKYKTGHLIVDLTIQNNTKYYLNKIIIRPKLTTPNSPTPLVAHQSLDPRPKISLPPGEEKEYRYKLHDQPIWRALDAQPNSKLTFEVEDIYFEAEDLNLNTGKIRIIKYSAEEDRKKIIELKKQINKE